MQFETSAGQIGVGMAMRGRPTTTVRESPGGAQLHGGLAETQHTRSPPQADMAARTPLDGRVQRYEQPRPGPVTLG